MRQNIVKNNLGVGILIIQLYLYSVINTSTGWKYKAISMVLFHFSTTPQNVLRWARKKSELCKITLLSLFYNDFISWSYVIDTLLEPGYWCVDTFAKALGPIFVIGDIVLTSSVVAIAYSVGLPYYWENKGPYVTIPIVLFGQFFFVNVVFHYWKALTTHPGRIPLSPGPDVHSVIFNKNFICSH